MNLRSTTSVITFSNAFALSGDDGELPAGDYEVVVEEELLPGLSFQAYRRTATYLTVHGRGGRASRIEMRPTTDRDLENALARDRALTENHA
jgi:hypothetical protein